VSAYVNVHGHPIGVSARDAVLAIEPNAVCEPEFVADGYAVRRTPNRFAKIIGTGINEEAAWRAAWSRMVDDDIAKECAS
jgi:hypothetical protein